MTAPSENVSMTLNTTVYANVQIKKTFAQSKPIYFYVDKSIKMWKKIVINYDIDVINHK